MVDKGTTKTKQGEIFYSRVKTGDNPITIKIAKNDLSPPNWTVQRSKKICFFTKLSYVNFHITESVR